MQQRNDDDDGQSERKRVDQTSLDARSHRGQRFNTNPDDQSNSGSINISQRILENNDSDDNSPFDQRQRSNEVTTNMVELSIKRHTENGKSYRLVHFNLIDSLQQEKIENESRPIRMEDTEYSIGDSEPPANNTGTDAVQHE